MNCIANDSIVTELVYRVEEFQQTLEKVIEGGSHLINANTVLENEKSNTEKEIEALKVKLMESRSLNEKYQEEIFQLCNLTEKLQQQRKEALLESEKELSAQSQLLKVKYEVEVLNSKIKSLERELSGSKVELEHLRMNNQQLRRDLSRQHR
jgi:hypothetical protein